MALRTLIALDSYTPKAATPPRKLDYDDESPYTPEKTKRWSQKKAPDWWLHDDRCGDVAWDVSEERDGEIEMTPRHWHTHGAVERNEAAWVPTEPMPTVTRNEVCEHAEAIDKLVDIVQELADYLKIEREEKRALEQRLKRKHYTYDSPDHREARPSKKYIVSDARSATSEELDSVSRSSSRARNALPRHRHGAGADSGWEWPMTRNEKRERISIADKEIASLARKELRKEVKELRSKVKEQRNDRNSKVQEHDRKSGKVTSSHGNA
jgi:hypothetical protein